MGSDIASLSHSVVPSLVQLPSLETKMKIFKKSELFLAIIGLGTEPSVQIAGKNIPRTFLRLAMSFLIPLAIVMQCILCIKYYSQGIIACLWPLCTILSFLATSTVYICFVLKTEQIHQLFSYLESLINKSNASLFYLYYWIT